MLNDVIDALDVARSYVYILLPFIFGVAYYVHKHSKIIEAEVESLKNFNDKKAHLYDEIIKLLKEDSLPTPLTVIAASVSVNMFCEEYSRNLINILNTSKREIGIDERVFVKLKHLRKCNPKSYKELRNIFREAAVLMIRRMDICGSECSISRNNIRNIFAMTLNRCGNGGAFLNTSTSELSRKCVACS